MKERKIFRVASVLTVLAFIAAMANAWLAAPGQMALVTASATLVYWLNESRKGPEK